MPTTVAHTPLPQDRDAVSYAYGPDSELRRGVRPGTIERFVLDDSVRYPGTHRTVWVHRPARHDPDVESAVLFCNDGWWYLDPDGAVRAGTVLDNLAAAGELPPLVSVFVDPGVVDVDGVPTKHRNAEYDAFDDTYGSFLLEEVLPLVAARSAVATDPMRRAVCGGSSGGNAAFTAAWCRPDGIGRVIAFNASFAQMPGGIPYPALLAAGARPGSRFFLQAAHRDLGWNEPEMNWFAENLETTAALVRAGQDVRLVVGDGGHSPNHGGVLLPDALRWIWTDPAD